MPILAVGLAVVAATTAAVVFSPGRADALTSTTIASQASASSVALGGTVDDTATVQGDVTNGSPTGSVSFYACQTGTTQTLTTGPCANAPGNLLGIVGLTGGASNTATATFSSFSPTSTGTWCFSTAYGGSGTYSSSQDNTSSGNLDTNECLLVTTVAATISTTTTPATMILGSGTVTDAAKVMGTVAGGSPTGAIDFYVCLVSASTTLTPGPCAATGTPEDSGQALVAGGGDASSASSTPFTPSSVGTWCFSVTYNGDQNYSAVADNTTSGNQDSGECMVVESNGSTTATTVSRASLVVGPSGTVTDSVTVTGNSAGGAPTGTVDFYVCGPTSFDALCTSTGDPVGTPTLGAAGSTSSRATSGTFGPPSPGIYCFAAVYVPAGGSPYAGSADNNSGSVDPAECLSALPPPFTITSGNHATAVAGQSFTFQVTTTPVSSPTPRIGKKGHLPPRVRLVNNHNGTATMSGTPKATKTGLYRITIKATWGSGKKKHVATQQFTLDVTP